MPQLGNPPWLLAFLQKMSKRPGAYLGAEDVRSLDLYLMAYAHARNDLGLPDYGPGEESLMADFHRWLETRLQTTDTRGWWGLVEREDPSKANVHTFIALFDEFLKAETDSQEGLRDG
jgi:hypothetical protein